MKQIISIILILTTYVFIVSTATCKNIAYCSNPKQENNIYFDFIIEGQTISFDSRSICQDKELLKKWGRNLGNKEISKTSDKILKMGFSSYTSMQFLFPGMEEIFCALEDKINTPPTDAQIEMNNNGEFNITTEHVGKKIQREKTAQNILKQLNKSNHIKIEIAIDTLTPKINKSELLQYTNKKSEFSTYCSNSTSARKHNIKLALKALNGKKINQGETFSFNEATGERSSNTGYKKAKIIQNGQFIEGTGGGVCQVSTTLYNAALLAGLNIEEVHQHSLPVSYVDPSRDAMVNGNYADLKFSNNTSGPLFIKAKLANNEKINIEIYGEKNKYNYKIESKITQTIPPPKDKIIKNIDSTANPLKTGQEHRISNAKNGYISESYIIIKDKNNHIIKKQKIRNDKYSPTGGIIIKT